MAENHRLAARRLRARATERLADARARCTAPTSRRRSDGRRTTSTATCTRGDGLVTDQPGVDPDGPGRRLRAGAARRPGGRRRSAPRTPAGPGWSPGVVPATVARDARPRRRAGRPPGSGPHVCGALLRGARASCSDEVAAVEPAAVRHDLVGHARRSTSAPACAPSSSAPASRSSTSSRCTRESPDLFSYRRDGAARPAARPGVIRMTAAMTARATRSRPASTPYAERIADARAPRPAATPTR